MVLPSGIELPQNLNQLPPLEVHSRILALEELMRSVDFIRLIQRLESFIIFAMSHKMI